MIGQAQFFPRQLIGQWGLTPTLKPFSTRLPWWYTPDKNFTSFPGDWKPKVDLRWNWANAAPKGNSCLIVEKKIFNSYYFWHNPLKEKAELKLNGREQITQLLLSDQLHCVKTHKAEPVQVKQVNTEKSY